MNFCLFNITGTDQTLDMASGQPSHTQQSSEHKPVAGGDDRVYSVVTDRTIRSLMSEYKKHKQVHTMPTFVKATRSRLPPKKESDKDSCNDPIEQEIEKQQKSSIMKASLSLSLSVCVCVCVAFFFALN